jgi:chromosomal replication initiation ATPase DnaA
MDKETLISVIAEVFNVDKSFVSSRVRKRRYTYPKKALCMYLYNNSELTYEVIAEYLEYSNHTSVLYHVRSGQNLYDTFEPFTKKLDSVYSKLREL